MPQVDPKSSYEQEQQQIAKTFTYPYPYPQHFEDNTIDFYEMCFTLWKRKWLVISVTVIAALGSIVFALVTPRVYKAEALLLPPKAKDVQSLNVLGIELIANTNPKDSNSYGISSDAVFKKFKRNLSSRTLHKKFIHEKGLMELLAPDRNSETKDQDIYKGFASLIKLGEKSGITSLSIELHDAEIATKWVNDLVAYVDKETIAMLVEDSLNSITNRIRDIEYTIASKRQMAKQRRKDQITRYNEAANIANDLKIKRRVDATNIIQNTQMNVDIATATTPLYYLGYEALMTEIYILRSRKSDDPFIPGLRDLQEQLALMRTIKFDKEKMSAVHIDQAAYPPRYAKSPTAD